MSKVDDFVEFCEIVKENPKKMHLLERAVGQTSALLISTLEANRIDDFRRVMQGFGELVLIWPKGERMPFDFLLEGRGAELFKFLLQANMLDAWTSIMEKYTERLRE
jgi:hypothetical protein